MNNEERVAMTEEELNIKRANAVRFEEEGDALLKQGNREEATDRFRRSSNLRFILMLDNAEHENWDDFLRITEKYCDLLKQAGNYQKAELVSTRILHCVLKVCKDKESFEYRKAYAKHMELAGSVIRHVGRPNEAIRRYDYAAKLYELIGYTEKTEECRKLAEEIRSDPASNEPDVNILAELLNRVHSNRNEEN